MTTNINSPYSDELQHYGILGMRWGHHNRATSVEVTRAQDTLKKRKQILGDERHKYNVETKYGMIAPSRGTLKSVNSASREYGYAKQDLNSIKILDRLKTNGKSKLQLSTEEKYKQKGLSDDEAAVAAYQNIRTKKILLAVGATTLAVAGGYAAYKLHDARTDKIIKSGTLLQNISANDNMGVRDAFYSSKNKLDNIKYKGLYGNHLDTYNGGAFKKQIKVLSDIKQASPKNAQLALDDLAKANPEFTTGLKEYIKYSGNLLGTSYTEKARRAEQSLSKGIVDKNVYEVFNAGLVIHAPNMQKLTDTYFDKLAKSGYNAIRDVNDSKYSGYNTINPIIAFNSAGKVGVIDVKKLTSDEIKKAGKIAEAALVTPEAIKQGAGVAAYIFGLTATAKAGKHYRDSNIVKQYKQKHPNTKMTNTEIIRMIERSK